MTENEIKNLIQSNLGENAERPGWVLYSGRDTLQRHSDYYLMGYNPALDSSNENIPLINTCSNAGPWSAYLDQCWRCDGKHCNHKDKDGLLRLNPHQKNVGELFSPSDDRFPRSPQEVFAANAIFVASYKARCLKREEDALWAQCWPVHQAFLRKIRPKYIISLGMGEELSSFSLLRRVVASNSWKVSFESKVGKHIEASLDIGERGPLDVQIIAVFHPSYYRKGRKAFVAERLAILAK